MTTPGPGPHPAPAIHWPAVFGGIGALFVRCDNDPDVQAERIPGLTWCAVKVNGADASPPDERAKWAVRMLARGVKVGEWVYCDGPPDVDTSWFLPGVPFVIYDVERDYKRDEGGVFEWAAQLVAHHKQEIGCPAAVTSYGGYKSSIDFAAFAKAGWPILAQCYDSFKPGDELTYTGGDKHLPGQAAIVGRDGPYPADGVHQLLRSLKLKPGQAVYRPESIDG